MEATVVCVDNSEWTRNGDYTPDRFQAQSDAVNFLAHAKSQANPESAVGVLTMAGRAPRMMVTPTSDLSKVLNCTAQIEIDGDAVNMGAAVQIAHLALKHRPNKNQRQRIVLFAGSPISEEKDALVKIAKKLKKNNVAVDIVSFGCEAENAEKLQAFHSAVTSSDNSHYVSVPAGAILSDVLISSPVFQGESGAGYSGTGGMENESYEFGVDPNLDPDLAIALRVSMEEERARQNAAAREAAAQSGEAGPSGEENPATAPAPAAEAKQGAKAGEAMEVDDEDPLLQEALAISMQAIGDDVAQAGKTGQAAVEGDVSITDDDAQLQMALQMSMEGARQGQKEELDRASVLSVAARRP
ncbi:unnamed protein product [Ostreobium quekettii]|uniref:26S proteasome non-ATPase regulatory subunit 4 homolog n=1 Tax=Ostreobium quekettii TaxID=121088 RepID=A0A8S1IMP3_9CHLO|nr:unnamed protein product [Ostreobium quekettii]|eukprot:evm.model.scf_109.7 EVM.evm.TU.scf_109.7   scf_109:64224-66669(+)